MACEEEHIDKKTKKKTKVVTRVVTWRGKGSCPNTMAVKHKGID